jgi:hypothetical protein
LTVCVVGLCNFNYAPQGQPDDWGVVAIMASDRMITFGDVQYEPDQLKVAQLVKGSMLLIAGDCTLHSEAIKKVQHGFRGREGVLPIDAALTYGRTIQDIKRRRAEDIYLAPLGLNADLLNAQQKEMSATMVSTLIEQMQNYLGEDVEGLVVGMEVGMQGEIRASIYHIDTRGSVTCADDVGFAAIGSGAWHARSQLMQARYTKSFYYYPALATLFAAKKAADTSPGVGSRTDITVLFKSGPESLLSENLNKMEELYSDFVKKRQELADETVKSFVDLIEGAFSDMIKQHHQLNQPRKLMKALVQMPPKPHEQARVGKKANSKVKTSKVAASVKRKTPDFCRVHDSPCGEGGSATPH